MKKRLLGIFCAIFTAASLFALDVNEEELRSTGGEDVVRFENYTGPHSVIESVETINSIGSGLGNQVRTNVNRSAVYGSGSKYTVIHAVDSTTGKLDADIILINANATVDHIRNLRRIIASYLSAAYGYNEKDASTVATFVTVYNAVYRGKLDVFQSKYKDVVTGYLTKDKCGLSTKWSDWAGNSQIVIPLGDLDGGLSTVDTSVISDTKVVESMQEEDDKGIDERKNMVDIKEREAEAASEKAQDSAKKAAEENKKLDEQKQNQKNAEENAEQKKKDAQEAQKAADADPSNKKKQQEAQEKQSEAQEAEQKAQEEKQKTEEQKQKTEEARQEAQEAQQTADKKQSEAQAERSEIAKDQQKLIQQEIAELNKNSVIGLTIKDTENQLSAMVKVNTEDGSLIRESPVTVIRGRTILPVESPELDVETATVTEADSALLYMAICGQENSSNGAVKLCLLDAFKMVIQKESREEVSATSVLVNEGKDYYCVIKSDSKYVIGKYDKSLNLLLKSPVYVAASTPIVVTDKGIVATSDSGKVILLKLEDLTLISDNSFANVK